MRVMAYIEPHPKSGVFQFRRRIPADLQPVLGRKTHYESLRTKDPRVANQRGAEADARFEAMVEEARQKLAASNGQERAGTSRSETDGASHALLTPKAANEALTHWKASRDRQGRAGRVQRPSGHERARR